MSTLVIEQDNSIYKVSPKQEKNEDFTQNHMKHITNILKKIWLGAGIYTLSIFPILFIQAIYLKKK